MLKILMANAKEADAVLNNYGKFSEPSISRMEQAPSSESFNNTTTESVVNDLSGTSQVSNSNSLIQNTQSNQKFVVCPKCGEKIYL